MSVPIGRNVAGQTVYVSLFDGADIVTTPTIAAGDIQISLNGAAFANMATPPSETPAASGQVQIPLSAAETNAVHLGIRGIDQAGAQWDDFLYSIFTDTDTIGGLSTTLAAIQASLATILARIGAFTGAGVNTILGVLQAMAQKAATLPTDIGGTFTPVLHSLEAIRDALQRSPAVASITANELTMIRGDTYDSDNDDPITGLGDITGRTALWFTAKRSREQADTAAIIQGTELGGLIRLNGAAAANAAWASITVTDQVAGDIRLVVDENATQDLVPATIDYDIQVLIGGNVTTLRTSTLVVPADVTRSIT